MIKHNLNLHGQFMIAVRSNKAAANFSNVALRLLSSCVFFTSLFCGSATAEEQKLYTVEMIIIKHLTKTDEETWPNTLSLSYPENLVFLNDGHQPIPEKQKTLNVDPEVSHVNNNLHQRIKESRDYRVLYHQSWVQQPQDEESSANIVIRAGPPIEGVYPIAGSIKIFKSRYLHLRSNLWFVDFAEAITSLERAPYSQFEQTLTHDESGTEPQIQAQPQRTVWAIPPKPLQKSDKEPILWSANIDRISQINQKRRMRSNEIHYIDHPLYGIILEIRPVK